MDESVYDFLRKADLLELVQGLEGLGVKSFENLDELEPEDYDDIGMKKLHKRRFERALQAQKTNVVQPSMPEAKRRRLDQEAAETVAGPPLCGNAEQPAYPQPELVGRGMSQEGRAVPSSNQEVQARSQSNLPVNMHNQEGKAASSLKPEHQSSGRSDLPDRMQSQGGKA